MAVPCGGLDSAPQLTAVHANFVPLYAPVSRHVRALDPLAVKPVSQENKHTLPASVPLEHDTEPPTAGAAGKPQSRVQTIFVPLNVPLDWQKRVDEPPVFPYPAKHDCEHEEPLNNPSQV